MTTPAVYRPGRRPPVTVERLKEMLIFAADLVDRRGPVAQPLLDRIEREYRAATRGSEADRIRKMLEP